MEIDFYVIYVVVLYSVALEKSINIGAAALVVASAVAAPVLLLASAPLVQAVPCAVALWEALSSAHALRQIQRHQQ